ncbi:heme-degrading domain-containing protein [Lactiplantibacillus pentosus]|uniref:heme-degrading domain-containing protein n=1 Tax=Lactiplantibacillus pentosus TaxID=1589 RepID=UPI0021A8610D|nr:heme-degrading domain-containing protein [Lactiplantibacillus pentosus]
MLDQAKIIKQENNASLEHFNLSDVDQLVSSLKKVGQADFDKVCILIKINKRVVFFHAGIHTTNENNLWIHKKENIVDKFDHSSLLEKAIYADDPEAFYANNGLNRSDYAIVGGGFPIEIKNTGTVGSLIVSGLTDEEDHELAYHALLDLQSQQG